jgi:hypothetical protein
VAAADDLVLAPGKSVTLLDAADPTVRVVITAPPNAPLNLSAILPTDPKEGMRSVVTRLQLSQARLLAANADGSVSLVGPGLPGPAQRTEMLEGGVLVYNEGKYTVYPAAKPAAASVAPAPRPVDGGPQITKTGTTREQAERDLRQCRAYADGAAAHFLTAASKSAMHNMAMASCLRGFGYEIHAPGG